MGDSGEEELERAADVLVRTVLKVARGERLVVAGDRESVAVHEAIDRAARALGVEVNVLRLDQLRSQSTNHSGERPHKVLPDAVRRAMLTAQASVFVASAPHNETSMREQVVHIVGARQLRHAHMAGVSAAAFAAGLCVDHEKVLAIGHAFARKLDVAREITCESAEGTRLVVHPGGRRWVPMLGEAGVGQAVTFPAGSLIVAPESVRGRFVASASLGEFFGAREGLLREPVVFDIEDGHVRKVSCPSNAQLVKDVEAMLAVAPNSERVGLVVIGANPGLTTSIGDATVDQTRPGLHLVFGDPRSALTDAGWSARTSFAACQLRSTVRVDGEKLVDDGAPVV